MTSKSIHLKVDYSVYEQLEKIRKKKGRLSVQEVIREAISEYLEREGIIEVF